MSNLKIMYKLLLQIIEMKVLNDNYREIYIYMYIYVSSRTLMESIYILLIGSSDDDSLFVSFQF